MIHAARAVTWPSTRVQCGRHRRVRPPRPTKPPSSAWSGPSCLNRTTNGRRSSAADGRRSGRSDRREASISLAALGAVVEAGLALRLRRRRRPCRHPRRRQPPRQGRTQSEASQDTRLPRRYRRPPLRPPRRARPGPRASSHLARNTHGHLPGRRASAHSRHFGGRHTNRICNR
jgi:hypothetical protein